mgnify:CR=1 FL=1
MEKNVEISMLCQIYGKVLTKKQYEVITDYYNNDLSLSEIAENNDITRQAVRDIIKKTENKLYELEKNIGFMKKILEEEELIINIKEKLQKLEELENVKINSKTSNDSKEKKEIISEIRKRLNKII